MLHVGVDVTWLHDLRGMGRYVRAVLAALETHPDVQVQRMARTRSTGVLSWRDPALGRLDVCWYPWNRIDVAAPTRRVVTIHDAAAVDWPATGRLFAFLDNRKAYRMLHHAVRRADRVMAVSDFTRQRLETLFQPRAVDVVTEGVHAHDVAEVVPVPSPFVLYVGAVEPRKNVDGLLRAWKLLVDDGRAGAATLVLRAGPELPSPPQTRWLGPADEAHLAWLYRNCAALVMPSLYEGFGLPVLEAMAAGAPVACSREASLPEVGGKIPLYFDPRDTGAMADAIHRVVTDSALADVMRRDGPLRAAEFTWEKASSQVLASLVAACR